MVNRTDSSSRSVKVDKICFVRLCVCVCVCVCVSLWNPASVHLAMFVSLRVCIRLCARHESVHAPVLIFFVSRVFLYLSLRFVVCVCDCGSGISNALDLREPYKSPNLGLTMFETSQPRSVAIS